MSKKIIGYLLWIVAFIIPFRTALLNTSETGNVPGLISFVAMLALLFIGYALVDASSSGQEAEGHGH
ncbi:MAG: hypothetical protein KDB88_11845 [Flavobacteriales bacterium]|nr:hypothetical protein [Flavobacteriales bacterium]